MNKRLAMSGDSGGPWFYSKTAYGVHKGYRWIGFKNRDVWSAVAYLDEALDVTVLTS